MLQQREPKKILYLQPLTLGLYFYHWCARAGGEVNGMLGRRDVPTAWIFLIPYAGALWWGWQYASALQLATQKRIKRDDTFLLFMLVVLVGGFGSSQFNFNFGDSSSTDISLTAILVTIAIILLIFLATFVFFGTLFCYVMQKRINTYATAAPPTPPAAPIV